MQDRFKFRCWHEPTKTMYEVFDFNENFIRATPDLVVSSIRTLNAMDCVLMQCTGLKDKNDKLIYEGDIVKFKSGNEYRNGKVEYSQTIWSISNAEFINRAYIGGALINMYSESEVIGNIYENSELLNEVK